MTTALTVLEAVDEARLSVAEAAAQLGLTPEQVLERLELLRSSRELVPTWELSPAR